MRWVIFATGFNAADGRCRFQFKDEMVLNWARFGKTMRMPIWVRGATISQFFLFNGPNTGIGHTSTLYT